MNDMNPSSKGDMGGMNPGAHGAVAQQGGNGTAQAQKKDDKLSMMKDILKNFIKKWISE